MKIEIRKKNHVNIESMKIQLDSKSKTREANILHGKCLCWSVRGHKRYYKSGKVVYIKPYKKGRDRDKAVINSKEYTIVSLMY